MNGNEIRPKNLGKTEICSVVSETKHAYRQSNTISPLCVLFMNIVQITHCRHTKNQKCPTFLFI
jgi:hypothetical protein